MSPAQLISVGSVWLASLTLWVLQLVLPSSSQGSSSAMERDSVEISYLALFLPNVWLWLEGGGCLSPISCWQRTVLGLGQAIKLDFQWLAGLWVEKGGSTLLMQGKFLISTAVGNNQVYRLQKMSKWPVLQCHLFFKKLSYTHRTGMTWLGSDTELEYQFSLWE